MKSTLVIAFNAGVYGTYLEWVLNTLITDGEPESPFTDVGNSHNSKLGHSLCDLQGFKEYLQSDKNFATVRLHPKTHKDDCVQINLEFLLENAPHVILLYPDRDHELMCVCNYMTKIWKGDPFDGAMSYINPDDIYQGYGIEPGTDLRNIPTWIRREHMSFNLFTSWHAQVEWYFPDRWQDDRILMINTKELFYDFKNVLLRIEKYWNRSYRRKIDDILPYHCDMISLQPHIGKDAVCAEIINCLTAVDATEEIEYGDICLVSQAWIQYQLRLRGLELRCHGLDVFPKNTRELRQLIYTA